MGQQNQIKHLPAARSESGGFLLFPSESKSDMIPFALASAFKTNAFRFQTPADRLCDNPNHASRLTPSPAKALLSRANMPDCFYTVRRIPRSLPQNQKAFSSRLSPRRERFFEFRKPPNEIRLGAWLNIESIQSLRSYFERPLDFNHAW